MPGPSCQKQVQENLVSRFKISSNLNISEKRHPQDGSFRFDALGPTVGPARFLPAGSVGREGGGPDCCPSKRPGDPWTNSASVPELYRILGTMVERPQGMVLVVGPTGSGKSTTLHALLQTIHRPRLNMITLEDPMEYIRGGMTQVQVNEKIGLTLPRPSVPYYGRTRM